jgi:hypothetical protein
LGLVANLLLLLDGAVAEDGCLLLACPVGHRRCGRGLVGLPCSSQPFGAEKVLFCGGEDAFLFAGCGSWIFLVPFSCCVKIKLPAGNALEKLHFLNDLQ